MKQSKKRKFSFKKTLRVYIVFLILLTILATIYVINTLKKYEKNQINNYLESVIDELKISAKKKNIGKKIDHINAEKSKFENNNVSIEEGLNELLSSDYTLTYKENEKSKDELNPIYDIYINGNKIFEIELDGSNVETRLSLLTFSNWKTKKINVEANNGFVKYNIAVPSNYKVYVNDKELTEEEILESDKEEGLVEISKYVEIPYEIKYEVNGLIKKPETKILDSKGNKVNLENIKLDKRTIECETAEEARQYLNNMPNILNIAENWSLFLSKDLSGSKYGFSTISKYLIKDSALYDYAYKWATNVDITFISNHTLKTPAFTNEKVSNFIIYNEKAFSCEVYLEKNMRLARGTDLTDTMNEKMYFAYYDDDGVSEWKLVNMQSLSKNK